MLRKTLTHCRISIVLLLAFFAIALLALSFSATSVMAYSSAGRLHAGDVVAQCYHPNPWQWHDPWQEDRNHNDPWQWMWQRCGLDHY